ncbi:DNA-binding domain-containing protein [Parabacteroides sp.]
MAEKTILSADLYDNVLTEKPGDYTAKPQITGSLHNPDIAYRIVDRRTEYRPETVINIMDLSDDEKVRAIIEGKSLSDGLGQYILNISGPFEGENPKFDPKIHKAGITFTPGKKLLEGLKNLDFKLNIATTGPVVNSITDSATGGVNTTITSVSPAVIAGSTLLIKGDHPSVGVFFTEDKADATPQKVRMIVINTTSQIVIQVPKLTPGQYRLSVTTQAGSNYKMVKEPRTYLFPILLNVVEGGGGSDSESPDEI